MFFNKLKKIINLPLNRKIIILEAVFWLPVMKFIIHFIPMKIYTPFILGEVLKVTSENEIRNKEQLFENMKWGINLVSEKMPWNKKCFAMAATAKIMLRYRGINSTLYLGLSKKENQRLGAHAWLRAGNFYITGGDGKGYTVVSYFS